MTKKYTILEVLDKLFNHPDFEVLIIANEEFNFADPLLLEMLEEDDNSENITDEF